MKKNNQFLIIFGIALLFVILISYFGLAGLPQAVPSSQVVGLNPQQAASYGQLKKASSEETVIYPEMGIIRFLSMDVALDRTGCVTTEDCVVKFLKQYLPLFQVSDVTGQFKVESVILTDTSTLVNLYQEFRGVPVLDAALTIEVDRQDHIRSINGAYASDLKINTSPAIDSDTALRKASDAVKFGGTQFYNDPFLAIYSPQVSGDGPAGGEKLVWMLPVISPEVYATWVVDAHSGEFLDEISTLETVLKIEVYDASGKDYTKIINKKESATLVINENGPLNNTNPSQDARNVASQFQIVYDYYASFGGKDLNDFSKPLKDFFDKPFKAYLNPVYNTCNNNNRNAWWDGQLQGMGYCQDSTDSIDVAAHEVTHGVTRSVKGPKITGLFKASESGALMESYSDIFAAFISHHQNDLQGTNNDPWLISFDSAGNQLVRNLRNPSSLNNPAHYKDFVKVTLKGGQCAFLSREGSYMCSHVNSTIHSHAVYLLVNGGEASGVHVDGIGFTKAEQIFFHTLTGGKLKKNANFKQARLVTLDTCKKLIGKNGITDEDCNQVKNAFAAVGIGEPGTQTPTQVSNTKVPLVINFPTNTASMPVVVQPSLPPVSVNSNTVLVMDCSGSMAEQDENGTVKIEASRKAATNLINVIESENEAIGAGGNHQVGLVRFSTEASVVSAITNDTAVVRNGLSSLTPSAATGMADGLKAGMDLFSAGPKDKPIIILLSDGMPNIPLGGAGSSTSSADLQSRAKQDVLDLAAQAGQQGICLYTVGFGDPRQTGSLAWIDEDYLRSVAQASGCGQYFNARDANQLTNVFINMRHISMGSLLMEKSGDITQGQTVALGNVDVSAGQDQALITLNWPGSRLEPQITDPTGITVGETYPGASVKTYTGLKSISINKPKAGRWLVNVFGAEVPSGQTVFHLAFSTRGSPVALPAASALPADNSFLLLGILLIFILAGAIYASTRGRHGGASVGRMRGPHLDGLSGLMQGRQIPLSARLLIGRRSDCQLVLQDMSVSRHHASIWFDRGSWTIDDLRSSGGTFVNQRQVTRQALREGDTIRIGDSTFIFHIR